MSNDIIMYTYVYDVYTKHLLQLLRQILECFFFHQFPFSIWLFFQLYFVGTRISGSKHKNLSNCLPYCFSTPSSVFNEVYEEKMEKKNGILATASILFVCWHQKKWSKFQSSEEDFSFQFFPSNFFSVWKCF